MQNNGRDNETLFSKNVAGKERRRLQAKKTASRSVWLGFGFFGMVGWSVAVPALAGIAAGIWLDKKWPAHFSWTLTLLWVGLMVGCAIAWQWVTKENKATHKQEEDKNE